MLWYGVSGIIASVKEIERAREGVAILLNDVWHNAVVDFGFISRILWIKFKFSRVKVKKGESIWNDLDRIVDIVGNRYRLCLLGDLNGLVGDK